MRKITDENRRPRSAAYTVQRRRIGRNGPYVRHAHALLADGCVGLVPFGTTDEGPSVGLSERTDAVDALVDGGIDPAHLLIGTGTTSLTDTAVLTVHAHRAGAFGVLLLPPFYIRAATDDGLASYVSNLCSVTDIDIYL